MLKVVERRLKIGSWLASWKVAEKVMVVSVFSAL
jgi:hypothetical protein